MKMKQLRILIQGSKHPSYKVQIHPLTGTSDILAYLKLDGDFELYLASDSNKHLTSEEPPYDYVRNNQKLIARASVKIDVEEARRELRKLVEVDDDPPPEPIDTTDSDEYIRSFFKKE